MPFRKRTPLDDRVLLERLSKGQRTPEIASSMQMTHDCVRKEVLRLVKRNGARTREEAIAKYTAEKIKRTLPLGVQKLVDDAMK